MRCTLIILLLLAVAVTTATGQNKPKNKVRIGIKAGYNYINTTNVQSVDGSNTGGFHAGMVLYGEEEGVKACGDLLYSKLGYKYRDGKVNLHYISTTEMADFPVAEDAFSLQIGVHVGYLISASADSSGHLPYIPGKKTTDFFNRFEFGIAGGAEFKNESGFIIGVRYTIGINDINKKQSTFIPSFIPHSTGTNVKSNMLQAYAGFRL